LTFLIVYGSILNKEVVMEQEQRRPVMVVVSFSVLPYQRKRLKELSEATGKPKSELGREALSCLFREYQQIGK